MRRFLRSLTTLYSFALSLVAAVLEGTNASETGLLAGRFPSIRKALALSIILGLLLFVLALRVNAVARANASMGWPSAEAVMTSTELTTRRSDEGFRYYCPQVSYRYSVDGDVYTGERIRFTRKCFISVFGLGAQQARNLVDTYQQGVSTAVYYSPIEPEISVLQAGKISTFDLLEIAFYTFLALGFLMLVLSEAYLLYREEVDKRHLKQIRNDLEGLSEDLINPPNCFA